MIEDKLLIWKLKHGSSDALARIYLKYESFLLTLATALLNDVHTAEDVLHDFFVSFAGSTDKLKLEGNLQSYLATCIANRARDAIRSRKRAPVGLDDTADTIPSNNTPPDLAAVCDEQLQQLSHALNQLPYEQREVVLLHIYSRLKFRQIAKAQGLSLNTIQSRYRYGINKLRSLLNGEVQK